MDAPTQTRRFPPRARGPLDRSTRERYPKTRCDPTSAGPAAPPLPRNPRSVEGAWSGEPGPAGRVARRSASGGSIGHGRGMALDPRRSSPFGLGGIGVDHWMPLSSPARVGNPTPDLIRPCECCLSWEPIASAVVSPRFGCRRSVTCPERSCAERREFVMPAAPFGRGEAAASAAPRVSRLCTTRRIRTTPPRCA